MNIKKTYSQIFFVNFPITFAILKDTLSERLVLSVLPMANQACIKRRLRLARRQ